MGFNVSEYIDSLIEAGVEKKHAKVIAGGVEAVAQSSALNPANFITKEHLKAQLGELENKLIKWMIGFFIGLFFSLAILMVTIIQINTEITHQKIEGIDQSLNQKIEAAEQSLNQKIETIDQRIDSIEKAVHQNQVLIQRLIDYQLQQAQSR